MDYNEYKERVRAATDIADVIGRYVDLKRAGTSSFKGLCPFHGEKTPSFFVMEDGQFYYCHGCHKGGDVFQFLCDYNNMEFSEAVNELAAAAGIEMPDHFEKGTGDKTKKGLKARLFEMHKVAAQYFHKMLQEPEGKKALDYLKGRGISSNTIVAFGMGYAPRERNAVYSYLKEQGFTDEEMKESGFFSYKSGSPYCILTDRVIFPIMNKASKVIAFGGRRLSEDVEPKYINSYETEIYKKKDNLFGIHRAQRAGSNRIFLVEGYMDVVSVQQAGFAQTVATLGTACTKEQAGLLAKMAKKVYLIYDRDKAGIAAMSRAIPILREAGLFVNVADMSPFKDPDELIKSEGREGFERRIDTAINSLFFELDVLADGYDRKDPSENGEFELATAKKLADIDNRFEREQSIKTAAGRYGIDVSLLTNEVNRIGDERMPAEGIVVRTVRNTSSLRPDEKKRPSSYADEKNILIYIMKVPEYTHKVKEFIKLDDFSEGMVRSVAGLIYDHFDSGKSINVAQIMSHFHNEDMGDIGYIFSDSTFDALEEQEQKKLLSDSVLSMLRRINEQKIGTCTNEEWQELIIKKKKLESMDNIFDG